MISHIKRVVSSKDGLIRWVVSHQGGLSLEGGTSVSSDGLSHWGSLSSEWTLVRMVSP